MDLVAVEMGLGTCRVGRGSFDQRRLHDFLQLPQNLEPLLSLTVGYPAESPKAKPRKNQKEIIYKII
jgi:nitroreductase